MTTALNVFPAEVWFRIIRISCTDTSFTARTLSLVSRDIYQLSKPYRVQSVSLCGISRIFSFYKALASSPELSLVTHLFIGCPNLREENLGLRNRARDTDEIFEIAAELESISSDSITVPAYPPNFISEPVLGFCIQRILTLVGTTLKHLHLHFIGFANIKLLPAHLPSLRHLVIYGAQGTFQADADTSLCLPSLRNLRIGYHNIVASRIIPKLSIFPKLVQFSLIQTLISHGYFSDLLDMIKKLDRVWPERGNGSREATPRKLLIEVETVGRSSGTSSSWYKQLADLATTTHRVEIVRKEWGWTDLQTAETEWVAETRKWVEAEWMVDWV